MKDLLKKWNGLSLIIRILIGLILGAFLGVVALEPAFVCDPSNSIEVTLSPRVLPRTT